MSSHRAASLRRRDESPKGDVIAFYVCSGAKEVAIDHAVFPHGSGCSEMKPCPARDLCVWYASHDLGGTLEYSDVPAAAQLQGAFTVHPFSCPQFRAIGEKVRQARKRK